MSIFAGVLAMAALLVVARWMWHAETLDTDPWTKDDQGAYEVMCAWERES